MIRRGLLHDSHVVELVLALLAMGSPMVSLVVSLETGSGEWFQRSGSLMVLFSVAVEYRRRHLKPVRQAAGGWLFRRQIPWVCYASILLGTLIWGYGDLLFR